MKWFITGGAGFFGINMTRFALEKGDTVVSFDISSEYGYPEKDDERVTVVQGDIRNLDAVRTALTGCDIVVNAGAALWLFSEKDIISTNVDGTRNVLTAANDVGIGRVIHMSTTALYGIMEHGTSSEDDEPVCLEPYAKSKLESEKVCEEFRVKGMTVPVLRPKTFIGPERLGMWSLLFDWASSGHGFPMIGSGNNRFQLLDVYDLCATTYLCAELPPENVNSVFNIGAEEFTTMREDYQAVLDYAGFGKKIRSLPAAPAKWALQVLELLRLSPINKWMYETAQRDCVVSIEKAKKFFGFNPRYSNKDALIRNYQWYLDNRDSFIHTSGVSNSVPWKQGILRIAKLFF